MFLKAVFYLDLRYGFRSSLSYYGKLEKPVSFISTSQQPCHWNTGKGRHYEFHQLLLKATGNAPKKDRKMVKSYVITQNLRFLILRLYLHACFL